MPEIIRSIQHLSHDIGRMMLTGAPKELTSNQGAVAHFIEKGNQEEGVLQSEVEKYFHIRRSSASAVLSALEVKGYIERRVDLVDSRMKRLFATPKLEGVKQEFAKRYQQLEQRAAYGLTDAEAYTLCELLARLKTNIEV